jgi:hypothetical protein
LVSGERLKTQQQSCRVDSSSQRAIVSAPTDGIKPMEEKDTENPIQNLLKILYNESLYRAKWLHKVTVDSVIGLLALYKYYWLLGIFIQKY